MKIVIILTVVLVLAAGWKWAFLPGRALPRHRVRHMRIRLHLRLHPGRGFATTGELWWRWGRLAAFRKSGRTRRSLSLWQRAGWPRLHSVLLGRAQYRHRLRVPVEEHVLVMAPPRTCKTAFLADVIMHYPGPGDLDHHQAGRVRADLRHPRRRGVRCTCSTRRASAGSPSTFRWSPLDGCAEPATAIRRADAFAHAVSQKGVEDGTFWSAKASDYLRAYFHAAALAGADMRTVARWVVGDDPDAPEQILAQAGAGQWAVTLAELRSEAHKTAATVRMVMSRALSFMADPALAASVLPGAGRVRHRRVPARARHAVHDRRLRAAGRAGRAAVRRDGQRDPLPGRADRPGLARRAAGPAAADGTGRGHPDLPRPAAVLAGRLRRQGHPGLRRRARRGPAGRPVGRAGQAGRSWTPARSRCSCPASPTPRRWTRPQLCGQAAFTASTARTTTPAMTSPPPT